MAAPGNWALLFYTSLKEYLASSKDRNIAATGQELADALLNRTKENAAQMAEASKPMLQDARQILTLSDSSSVERVILESADASCQITIAESRPLLEGRAMLRRIREG